MTSAAATHIPNMVWNCTKNVMKKSHLTMTHPVFILGIPVVYFSNNYRPNENIYVRHSVNIYMPV